MSRDDLRRVPESPSLPRGFRGVVLSSSAAARGRDLRVHGALQVPAREFEPGARVLDAVAIVATVVVPGPFGGGHTAHRAWVPFREWLVLEDDAERTDDLVRGWFNAGLPADLPGPPRGDAYVVASLGRYASEVLIVRRA